MMLSTPRRLLLSGLSGLLFFLAFPPLRWHWLAWIALAPLFVAVSSARLRVAALCGLVTTVCFYGLSVYWVFTIFRTHGRLSLVAAAGVQIMLLLYLAIYRVAFCVMFAWLSRRGARWSLVAAPFLWVGIEFAFVRTPHFSLPWNLLGYAATSQPGVLQLATITGVYGLSFWMAAYAAIFAAWVTRRDAESRGLSLRTLALATMATFAVQIFGWWLVPVPEARYTARLVQPNLSQSQVFTSNWPDELAPTLDELERLSMVSSAADPSPVTSHQSLIIWPEVPAPLSLQDARFLPRAQRLAQSNRAHFLLGTIEWRAGGQTGDAPTRWRPRNSAALLAPGGERAYTYDKIHLVPFGEYVPLREWLRFADSLVAEVGGFLPGTERTIGQLPGGKFATLICFEAVFPHEVREFTAGGAELLVNISNDGWLGRTGGPTQHMEMARMRAVENRRWLLRATNNGHTVSIDPYGRIAARLAPDQRAMLDAPYDFRSDVTAYARFGDWFAWLCVAVSTACLALIGRKQAGREV